MIQKKRGISTNEKMRSPHENSPFNYHTLDISTGKKNNGNGKRPHVYVPLKPLFMVVSHCNV
jgi:hypothetical protein